MIPFFIFPCYCWQNQSPASWETTKWHRKPQHFEVFVCIEVLQWEALMRLSRTKHTPAPPGLLMWPQPTPVSNASPSGVQELWMALEEMVTSGPGWLKLRRQTLDLISPYLFLSPSIFTFLCVSVSPDPFFLVAWVRVPSRGAHRTTHMGFMERWNCFFYQFFFQGFRDVGT